MNNRSQVHKNALNRLRDRLNELRLVQYERGNRPTQNLEHQFSLTRSESVHIMGPTIESYDKYTQCALESRSLESKLIPQENTKKDQDDIQEGDLLQSRGNRRKKQDSSKDYPNCEIPKPKQLTRNELDTVMNSKTFSDFFNRSTKFMEKVLDYGDRSNMMELLLNDNIKIKRKENDALTLVGLFSDPNLTNHRVVTDLDWSTQIPELFLASYGQKYDQENIKDHVGVVLVWTPSLRSRPEFYCFSQSAVTSAKFFPYSNSTIVGGCSNGQLLIWDFKVKANPILRSDMSADGHRYPISSLNVTGTQIANNIISFSNDGTMCIWDVRKFGKPIKNSTKLIAKRPFRPTQTTLSENFASRVGLSGTSGKEELHEVSVTCCKFPEDDPNSYYAGSLNGTVYKNKTHNTDPTKIIPHIEHQAPITSLSINSAFSAFSAFSQSGGCLKNLVLTSSLDWTVKLWQPTSNTSIRTFEHFDDYIYDVSWNPVNPSLFVTVGNDGIIDLFDLTRDLEMPVYTTAGGSQGAAKNRCCWAGDGVALVTGDTCGRVSFMVLGQQFRKLENSRLDQFEAILYQKKQEV